MKNLIPITLILLSVWGCSKEDDELAPECQDPIVLERFDSARIVTLSIIDARLAAYSSIGLCDTCFKSEFGYGVYLLDTIKHVVPSSSGCYDSAHNFLYFAYAGLGGAVDARPVIDSAELAEFRRRVTKRYNQILNYLRH
jgi:hypothetical protein